MASPFKFQEPATKVTTLTPGQVLSIEPPLLKRLSAIMVTAQCTKAAGGAGVTSIPTMANVIGDTQFKVGSSAQRTRTATELFGATGLAALVDPNAAGTVVYTQDASFADINSGIPVLIGSAADLVVQATLAANTATTARFCLPFSFAEPSRKDYRSTEALALPTGYDDGTTIGKVTLDLTIAGTAGVAPATISAQAVSATVEYDDLLQPKASPAALIKHYRFPVGYAATGQLEMAQQIKNTGVLIAVSLLAVAGDRIDDVEVKQGNRILKKVTWQENATALIRAGMNPLSLIRNRFDLMFDLLDDPNSAPVLDPKAELSIMANFGAVAGAANCLVMVENYGKLD